MQRLECQGFEHDKRYHVPHLNKNIASGYPPLSTRSAQGSNRGGFSRASTTILSETHTIKIMHGYPILNQEPYLSISVVSSRPFSTWDIQASGRVRRKCALSHLKIYLWRCETCCGRLHRGVEKLLRELRVYERAWESLSFIDICQVYR